VGLLGYDLGRELEVLPAQVPADVSLPDLSMGVYPFMLAEEVHSGRRVLAGRGQPVEAAERLADLRALGRHARPVPPEAAGTRAVGAPGSTFGRPEYEDAVRRILAHIRQGDIYQVNLSQRFELAYSGGAAELFEAVSAGSPVPFGSVLRTPDWALVSNSPELFLRRRGEIFESRPIKGTRPRSDDPQTDARLRAELEASEKELAELAMIVDLVRNDLGRSAVLGSVSVDLPFETDAWATVFHRLARVHGRLPTGADLMPVIEAMWPPASVTGTPKIRALEIIEDIEPVRRHAYTGAFGWIDAGGDCDLSVNIRIATLQDGRLLVPVGGGITVGSDPAAEYTETLHKARALFDAAHVPLPSGSLVA
jgi:para-aminobenzoate synthetase component 1